MKDKRDCFRAELRGWTPLPLEITPPSFPTQRCLMTTHATPGHALPTVVSWRVIGGRTSYSVTDGRTEGPSVRPGPARRKLDRTTDDQGEMIWRSTRGGQFLMCRVLADAACTPAAAVGVRTSSLMRLIAVSDDEWQQRRAALITASLITANRLEQKVV